MTMTSQDQDRPLRKGWTTGACAAAASRAAFEALVTGSFPDPVPITLPKGKRPCFSLADEKLLEGDAMAAIVKDAGDDPDVTHGALIVSRVSWGEIGSGITFKAGEGVGTVTRPGLPLPPGEPAINPVPRQMIAREIEEVAASHKVAADVTVEISIPGGEKIAERTMNGRLGIVGGLSILGTTGIVMPFSCSAWIHSIHRGIDVASAAGLSHVAGATGSTSEEAIARLHELEEIALIDMGDFVGGMLKYMRKVPIKRVSIAGGVAKMTKLGQGMIDLHSRRGEVDLDWLSKRAEQAGATSVLVEAIRSANTAKHAFDLASQSGFDLGSVVAVAAWERAARVVEGSGIELEIVLFNRSGELVARTPFRPA